MTITSTDFVSGIESRPFDESKHVNYTLGMLLGVDDFQQEFAYLAGRGRRLAADACGYGTTVGLRVKLDTKDKKGWRISVEPGSAITPRGQIVCVKPTQCAYLDEWLAAKRKELESAHVPVPGIVRAHVVLGYRDCPTDNVLTPGVPCRSEDEMKIPSRVTDSFQLELRREAPLQAEDDAIVAFIDWLRQVQVGGGAPTPIDKFESAISGAVAEMNPSLPEAPRQPGSFVLHFNPPPASLVIDPPRLNEYLRAAFRVWITGIRPLVHPLCGAAAADDVVLLANLRMPVIVANNGDWVVDRNQPGNFEIDEARRPTLLQSRMLQEIAIAGIQPDTPGAPYRVVAAGTVSTAGGVATSALRISSPADGKLHVAFDGYQDPRTSPPSLTYVAKIMGSGDSTVAFDSFAPDGIVFNVTRAGTAVTSAALAAQQFMIEVSRLG